jgi:hypothetical protein
MYVPLLRRPNSSKFLDRLQKIVLFGYPSGQKETDFFISFSVLKVSDCLVQCWFCFVFPFRLVINIYIPPVKILICLKQKCSSNFFFQFNIYTKIRSFDLSFFSISRFSLTNSKSGKINRQHFKKLWVWLQFENTLELCIIFLGLKHLKLNWN